MKKIIFGIFFILFFMNSSYSDEDKSNFNVYCLDTDDYYVSTYTHTVGSVNRRIACYQDSKSLPFRIEIPKSVYSKLYKENDNWFTKGNVDDPADNSWFGRKRSLRTNPDFIRQKTEALKKIYLESQDEIKVFQVSLDQEIKKQEIAIAEKNKLIEKEKLKLKFSELEKNYSSKCHWGYTKGTEKYNNCLLEQEKKVLADQKNKQDLAEANKKKQEAQAKQEAEKLAKMSPDDRRAYTCTEKFGFRKGSDNFKECVFKIYSAEIELEKLELQKQLAKANADLAKANAASNQKLADAQTAAAIMQAYAAQQQAIAANTADSLALMESGLRMMSPQRPAARAPMNCQYHAKMLSCF